MSYALVSGSLPNLWVMLSGVEGSGKLGWIEGPHRCQPRVAVRLTTVIEEIAGSGAKHLKRIPVRHV